MAYSSLSTAATNHHHHHTFSLLAGDPYPRFSLSSHNPDPPSTSSSPFSSPQIRRPKTLKTTTTSTTPPSPPKNPLKSLRISQTTAHNNHNLTPKLRLTSKISPPPPPPPPPSSGIVSTNTETGDEIDDEEHEKVEFRQEGKIFVGNLPLWIKKPEVFEFFRQFGAIKSVILIKGHEDIERNLGFGFVIFGGDKDSAEKSALKAVEFDGVEFHGRCLTVKLDDGRRLKNVVMERERWVESGEGREFRSKWHEERDGERKEFRRVVESQPENWQAVVRTFERIKKV